jgi:hypothetical protein
VFFRSCVLNDDNDVIQIRSTYLSTCSYCLIIDPVKMFFMHDDALAALAGWGIEPMTAILFFSPKAQGC